MSLSTSNFKTELRVIALVVLVLLACELVVRRMVRAVAWDVGVAASANELVQGAGTRILVLGNSMVREGVDTAELEKELETRAPLSFTVRALSPFNTTANDWYYVFKQHFADAGRVPEALVICFAKEHVEDAGIARATVAQYYADTNDLPEIFSRDIKDFDERADFLLSWMSVSFANRASVQRRVLDRTVPHYREALTRINDSLTEVLSKSEGAKKPSYHRLEDLIRLAASRGVRVFVVAMPTREPYPLDPEIALRAEANGATFIDSRTVAGLTPESFEDQLHLTEAGAKLFSRQLAQRIVSSKQ